MTKFPLSKYEDERIPMNIQRFLRMTFKRILLPKYFLFTFKGEEIRRVTFDSILAINIGIFQWENVLIISLSCMASHKEIEVSIRNMS